MIRGLILLLAVEEFRGVRVGGDFGDGTGGFVGGGIFASLFPILVSWRIRGVEVALEVRHGGDGVVVGRTAAPLRITVAPVRDGDVAGRGRDGLGHGLQPNAVDVELDRVREPVEAIFVKALIGGEG